MVAVIYLHIHFILNSVYCMKFKYIIDFMKPLLNKSNNLGTLIKNRCKIF